MLITSGLAFVPRHHYENLEKENLFNSLEFLQLAIISLRV